MGNRAADRASIANLRVADQPRRRVQQRIDALNKLRTLHGTLVRHRADRERITILTHVVQPLDAIDIDHGRGAGEAHVQQRDETLATSQELCLRPVLL